jgi:DNA-binding Lrp family transcriptional regulator
MAAPVAASVQAVPGVSEAASVVGPYDAVARAPAENIDKLAKLVASHVQALDGVTRTITCTVLGRKGRWPP